MPAVASVNVDFIARTENFTSGVTKAQRAMGSFSQSASKMGAGLRNLAFGAAAFGTAATTAAAAGLIAMTKSQFDSIDSLAKTSDKLGIATDKLAGLRFAAEQSGVAANTMDMALQRMTRRVAEAARGTGEAVGALDELGLSAEHLNSVGPHEAMHQIADAMAGVSNQGDRVRLAMKLFDSEGVSLVNTLAQGSAGLDAFQAEAESLGIAVNRVDASKIESANNAMNRVKQATAGLTAQIAIGAAPAVEAVAGTMMKWLAGATENINGLSKSTAFFRYVLTQVGDLVTFVSAGFDAWRGIWQLWITGALEGLSLLVTGFGKLHELVGFDIPEALKKTSDFLDESAQKTLEASRANLTSAKAKFIGRGLGEEWAAEFDKAVAATKLPETAASAAGAIAGAIEMAAPEAIDKGAGRAASRASAVDRGSAAAIASVLAARGSTASPEVKEQRRQSGLLERLIAIEQDVLSALDDGQIKEAVL